MTDQDGQFAGSESEFMPALIKVEQEAQVWKDVLEFKIHQQQSAQDRDACDGSGGKPLGSWEIVDCSHASECGSTARTIPGSEFGLSEHASGTVDLTQEFQAAHSRALAEIEAFEAAQRETALDTATQGSSLLPVSTDASRLSSSDFQVLTGLSSDTTPVPSDGPKETVIPALGVGEGLEFNVVADKMEPGVEIVCGVEELDGYSSTEDVQGLEGKHARSEPDSHDAMVELQEMSQEGSLDGNYWPECASSRGSAKLEVQEMPLLGAESFEDVRSAEGAFSEVSFDSPKISREVSHHSLVGTGSSSAASVKLETEPEAPEVGREDTMVAKKEAAVIDNAELNGIWLMPKVQKLLQNWTSIVVDLLPKVAVPRFLTAVNLAMCRMDWKGFACSASLVMLSSLVVGLIVENRRLNYEVRKKHEEASRLMKALMNFQELWSSHRTGKVPILRHTNFTRTMQHMMQH